MYNRYFSREPEQNAEVSAPSNSPSETIGAEPKSSSFEKTAEQHSQNEQNSNGGFRGLLGDTFKLPEFDSDTILLLILVYFLVADNENEHFSDALLIIGILLLLGF